MYYHSNFFFFIYPFLFVLNGGITFYLFYKDKSLHKHIQSLIQDTHIAAKFALVSMLVFHIFNCIYSMEPLNNLRSVNVQEIFQANELFVKHSLTELSRPMGFSVVICLAKLLTNADYIYINSILGIFFSTLTAVTLFLAIKHLTNCDVASLFGSASYVLMLKVVFFASSCVEAITPSVFLISVLIFLYLANSSGINTLRSILFCSTLLIYFRIENTVFLLIFIFYILLRNWKNHFRKSDYILASMLFLPHVYPIINCKYFLNSQPISITLDGIISRLFSFFSVFTTQLCALFFFLFLIGMISAFRKNKMIISLFFGIFSFYLGFQGYKVFLDRYMYNLLPFVIVLLSMGAYSIYSRANNKILKYVLCFLAVTLLTFGMKHNLFSRFSRSPWYIEPQIEMGKYLHGKKMILYGCPEDIYGYQRFYPNSVLFYEGPYDASSYEYVLDIGENIAPLNRIERDLNLKLILIGRSGLIRTYKIVR